MLTQASTNGSTKRPRASLADRSNTSASNALELSERPLKRLRQPQSAQSEPKRGWLANLRDLIGFKGTPRPLKQQLHESKHRYPRLHQAMAYTPQAASSSRSQPRPAVLSATPRTTTTAPQPEPRPSPYEVEVQEWKWAVTLAKAAGTEPPPKPARPPKTPKVKRQAKRIEGPEAAVVVAQLSGNVWKKKRPMGLAQHERDVARRNVQRKEELLRELQDEGTPCMSREKAEMAMSMEDYRARIRDSMVTASPIPVVKIVRSGSQRSLARPRSTTSMSQLLVNAKRTLDTPTPKVETFEYDKMKQSLEEAEAKSKMLDGDVRRGRVFPKRLKKADQEVVDASWANRSFQSTIQGGEVAHKDLIRLKGLSWLNDEVITFYAQLLNARSTAAHPKDGAKPPPLPGAEPAMRLKDSHTYNSFFYKLYDEGGFVKVQRWSRKFDTFAKQIIIIPMNLGNSHWVCGAINIEKKRFEYYDSLGGPNPRVYAKLRKYLEEEHMHKKKKPIDLDKEGWENYWDDDVPQQENSCDCGIFTCQFMECLSRETEGFDFTQRQMPYFRNKMALEVQQKKLIDEQKWDFVED